MFNCLAPHLGRTVGELEKTLSSSELTEWIAVYEMQPFGTWRDNYHAAQLTAMIANIHKGKNREAFKVGDFMYKDIQTLRDESTSQFMSGLKLRAKPKDG